MTSVAADMTRRIFTSFYRNAKDGAELTGCKSNILNSELMSPKEDYKEDHCLPRVLDVPE